MRHAWGVGAPQAVFRQKFLQSYRKARWPITRSAPNCGPRGGRTGPPGPRPDAGGRPRDPRLARRALEAPAGAPPAAPAAGRLVLQWQAQGQPARHETCAQRGASAQPRAVGRCAPASDGAGVGFPGRAGRVAQGPPRGPQVAEAEKTPGGECVVSARPSCKAQGGGTRAIQFSIFLSLPWAFDPFPPGGGRLGWGEKHGLGTPLAFTPTLALPRRGRGKRLTGAAPEN
jgi:hypothetical protein